ncbi:MAG TPA: hypothetical protein VG345_14325, partial [Bryobacteraceae bacterium]|nr:hypothetical protein [Bryobacteraceae bacterium]
GAWAAQTAIPGTLNYVEGQASLDGSQLTTKQIGQVEMTPDQMLSTGHGKAEILLSPGVFLRIGDNSQLRMISPELVDPRVELVHGEAMVEVDYLAKQARLNVLERGADASLLKEGLYKFNADEGQIQVIDGKATVTDNNENKDIGKGKEIVLSGTGLKPVKFDRKAEDDLYQWSNVRAQYLAEANQSTAQTIYVGGGGWWGPGWYWNPYFAMYSWLPGDGFFWSPFGYPFYSPGYVMYAPGIRRFYGGARSVGNGFRPGRAALPAGGFRGAGGGHFAAAPRMGFGGGGFHGGGFHGGGGGFHGGGGGGRR